MDDVDAAIEFKDGRVIVSLSVPEDDLAALESCLTEETVDQIIAALKALRG